MNGNSNIRQKILIADDSEMNRMMLIEMLGDKYDIIEVENGRQAIDTLGLQYGEISLLLLDLMMPEMDGFEVLAYMNRYGRIEDVPVIIISAESGLAYIQRGYDFGVTDFISRPFDAAIVRRRVENTLLLSAKQRRLTSLVMDQLYEKQPPAHKYSLPYRRIPQRRERTAHSSYKRICGFAFKSAREKEEIRFDARDNRADFSRLITA